MRHHQATYRPHHIAYGENRIGIHQSPSPTQVSRKKQLAEQRCHQREYHEVIKFQSAAQRRQSQNLAVAAAEPAFFRQYIPTAAGIHVCNSIFNVCSRSLQAACPMKKGFQSLENPFLNLFYGHNSNKPALMMMPVYSNTKTQNPMMSLAFKPAMAKAGKAQKGCIMFVHASPQAMAIAVLA